MYILQASPPITIHSNLKEQIQKKKTCTESNSWENKRERKEGGRERKGHTSALGVDRIIILLLFILSVSSMGPDLEQDCKKLSSLYILYVGVLVLVLLLFWGLGLYLFVEFFWLVTAWWAPHSYQQNSSSDGNNTYVCLQSQ